MEINSSFYRLHRRSTYERWAATVPVDFAFAVKVPKAITHVARLQAADELLGQFAESTAGLGTKLCVILVQLPPSLALDATIARAFFARLERAIPGADIACEPRHASWFTADADRLLKDAQIARVAADPAIVASGGTFGGWPGLRYRRLHGSPSIYRSAYDDRALAQVAANAASRPAGAREWCIFDNTALGAATLNALSLHAML